MDNIDGLDFPHAIKSIDTEGFLMPTTLPERRHTESDPSPRFLLAIGVATLIMIALIAYHARFKAWVSDAIRAEFVVPNESLG